MSSIDRVTCDEAFRLLDFYIDRELSPPEQKLVEAHLQTCESCAQDFKFETNLIAEMRNKIKRLDVPDDLMQKVIQRLREND